MSLLTNLLAYWKFDESSGNAADATGNGNTLTNNNSVPYGTGKINNGASFVASNATWFQKTTPTNLLLRQSFTISLWIKPNGNQIQNADVVYVSGNTDGDSWYGIDFSNGNNRKIVGKFYDGSVIRTVVLTADLTDNVWSHVVVTYDYPSGAFLIYLNGSLNNTTSLSANLGIAAYGNSKLVVGALKSLANFYFNGVLDEVGMWSRALSSSEVSQLYNSGAGIQYPFATFPAVATDAATGISDTGATLNGEITDIGVDSPDERGFVWGTTPQSDPGNVAPASSGYDDYETESGTFSTGTFDAVITGLTASTTYYVRAYARNSDGYAYGSEVSFSTNATPPFRFTNIEGVTYDPDDTQTIFAERLNDMLERIEALESA